MPEEPKAPVLDDGVFVVAPEKGKEPLPPRLLRLVRKFNPVDRDHRNRKLGKAGEEFVFALEQRRLAKAERSDLARSVR